MLHTYKILSRVPDTKEELHSICFVFVKCESYDNVRTSQCCFKINACCKVFVMTEKRGEEPSYPGGSLQHVESPIQKQGIMI